MKKYRIPWVANESGRQLLFYFCFIQSFGRKMQLKVQVVAPGRSHSRSIPWKLILKEKKKNKDSNVVGMYKSTNSTTWTNYHLDNLTTSSIRPHFSVSLLVVVFFYFSLNLHSSTIPVKRPVFKGPRQRSLVRVYRQ